MAVQQRPFISEYEHRIFGCYVRRHYHVTAYMLIVSQEVNNQPVFYKTPRYYQNNGPDPTRHVLVFIDSFFFLDIVREGRQLKEKFRNELFHPGIHLCLMNGPNDGQPNALKMTVLLMKTNAFPYQGVFAILIAIFPVIEDLDVNGTQKLVLGLYFKAYWDLYVGQFDVNGQWTDVAVNMNEYCNGQGHRQYWRFEGQNDGPVLDIPVHDLWEEFFLSQHFCSIPIPITIGGLTARYQRIGFYVCAGTKLIVIDGYNRWGEDPEKHNRTLILPGGLVVVEVTEMSFIMSRNHQIDRSCRSFVPLLVDLDEALTPYAAPAVVTAITAIRNPVFFLGAIQSKNNSGVWNLGVHRNRQITAGNNNTRYGVRTTELYIPNHSVIEAVEEWDVGIAEVIARHKYHQLHRGVTRLTNEGNRNYQTIRDQNNQVIGDFSQFEAPEQNVLTQITTNCENRDTRVTFDMTQAIIACNVTGYVRQPPQTEYYFSSSLSAEGLDEYSKRQIPPPPPAAYPPVHIGSDFYYLPNVLKYDNQMAIDLSEVYHKYKVIGDKVYIDLGTNGYLKLHERTAIPEYLWSKVNPILVTPIESVDLKLCVDGHWYQKQNIPSIGTFETQYYERVIPPIPPPIGGLQSPQQLQSLSQPTPPSAQGGSNSGQSQAGAQQSNDPNVRLVHYR